MSQKSGYTELFSNPAVVEIDRIPLLSYPEFLYFLDRLMGEEGTHCLAYFAFPLAGTFRFICIMAADENHAMVLFSHEQPRNPLPVLPSISARYFQFHPFEREIHENTGILFEGHPWLKPVRYPFDRFDLTRKMQNYPFYSIESDQLHEVGVGPVHAGIIEPGHFRFTCHGERVHHLEIQLGYQHRGLERLFTEQPGNLHRAILAESIAGDTSIGHSLAFCGVVEALSNTEIDDELARERSIALEMERIAMHLADTAALCNDVAYQLGQVVNEALRTTIINTIQLWCGNRFGKGLIRPAGSNYPLTAEILHNLLENVSDVAERYQAISGRIFTLPSLLSRFEGTGRITPRQATLIGAVGMAARSSGVYRDIRWSHPFAAYTRLSCEPAMIEKGDVWARAALRREELLRSVSAIRELSGELFLSGSPGKPRYDLPLIPQALGISLTEGWRGEICHVGITDNRGALVFYKVKDPSFHNWMALALALRNQEISDFPLCNKSFNLSYCGNDL